MVLLHGIGTSALEWRRAMPALARGRSVYAPDVLGPGAGPDGDYSPASLAGFVAEFLDAVGVGRAAVVGNSMGGLLALRLALADPDRVSALVLSDSAGLGREVTLVLSSATLSGAGEAAISLVKTPMGAAQRVWARTPLLFTLSAAAPPEWLAEQYRLALTPGFMESTLAALRGHVNPAGQREREVLLDELPRIEAPTLVVWGGLDKVVPTLHARDAVSRFRRGHLEIIPSCGHLPHAESLDRFAHTLNRFLDGERNGSHA